jgi:hypothetical protein
MVSEMTFEEAMAISERRLPGEPPEPDWRASRPAPEPKRRARGLDTAPQPEVDIAYVIRGAILAERSVMVEIVGQALGEYCNGILDQVETMIGAVAAEIREDFGRQIDQLRAELLGWIDEMANESAANVALIHGQGERLKAQLEAVIAKKTRANAAKTNGSADALPLADASLAPGLNGNGDGRHQ